MQFKKQDLTQRLEFDTLNTNIQTAATRTVDDVYFFSILAYEHVIQDAD